MAKLSARRVATEKKPGMHCDGGGLYLHVSATGARSWILRTTIQGKRRDIGLGGSSWVSLAEAREKAADLRKAAKEGRDPIAEKRQVTPEVPTLEQSARALYETLKPGWRSGGVHVKHWIASLENDRGGDDQRRGVRALALVGCGMAR